MLYARISIAEGKYHAVRHITCAVGANIDLLNIPSSTVAATTVPLLHKARQSRAGEGWQLSIYFLRHRRKYRARGARIPKGGRKEKCLSFFCRSFFVPFFITNKKSEHTFFGDNYFCGTKAAVFLRAVCDKQKIGAYIFRR